MKIPYVFKVCTECGESKVANTKYFRKETKGRYGLKAQCKECSKKRDRKYRQSDKRKEYLKEYKRSDKFKEYLKEYYQTDKYKESQKRRRKSDKYKESQKKYNKEYSQSDKRKEYLKEYHQTVKGQVAAFNSCQRRRIKEQNQGSGITEEQWKECMNFFGWKCAYSGKPLKKNNRSLDHVVPLNKGGANEIWNVVPMVKNYNSSKRDKVMEEWYKEQEFYSEERLQKIYEWLEYACEKWGENYEKDNNWNNGGIANNSCCYIQLSS